MSNLFTKLVTSISDEQWVDGMPHPIVEIISANTEVIRMPAWWDGREHWQGATFQRKQELCSVLFDDGVQRRYGTADEVIKFWVENSAEWAQDQEQPSYGVGPHPSRRADYQRKP